MYQYDDPTCANSLPTPAAPGVAGYFTDGNPVGGPAPTILRADFMNMLMEELINVVLDGGLTLSKTTYTQVRDAIRKKIQGGGVNYAQDSGTVNHFVVAMTPTVTALVDGMRVYFRTGNSNTGPADLQVDGTAAKSLVKYGAANVPLAPYEIQAGMIVEAEYSSAADKWNIVSVRTSTAHNGQCRLSVVSTTSLKLAPLDGSQLMIAGIPQNIPSAGVTITNSGLAASTLYYVYAYMNSGTMTLELSATGHATDANTGIEIKSGDFTRTLVGMIRTNASSQFVDSTSQRFCLNWYKRRRIGSVNSVAAVTTSSGSFVELNSSNRAEFLTWSDEELLLQIIGFASNNGNGNNCGLGISLDTSITGAAGQMTDRKSTRLNSSNVSI